MSYSTVIAEHLNSNVIKLPVLHAKSVDIDCFTTDPIRYNRVTTGVCVSV